MIKYIDSKFKYNRISVNFSVPLSDETAGKYAILSALMRKSSKKYNTLIDLSKRLDDLYGASYSTGLIKVGESLVISFGIDSLDDAYAYDNEQLLKESCELLLDIISNPNLTDGLFSNDEFLVEKQSLIDQINSEINEKRAYAINSCMRMLNPSDISVLSKYGTLEQANKICLKDITDVYMEMIKESSVEIAFIGPGDSKIAEKILSPLLTKNNSRCILPKVYPYSDVIKKNEYMDVVQSKMVLAFRCGERLDFGKHFAMALAISILGGTPSSLLFKNVREKKSLCYYCSASYKRLNSIMLIDCGVEKQNIEKAQEAILEEFNSLCNGNFSDETIEFTKLQLINSAKSTFDSTSSLESVYLTHTLLGEKTDIEGTIKKVESISREEIIDAAKKIKLAGVYVLTKE